MMGKGQARRRKLRQRLPPVPKHVPYSPNFLSDHGQLGYLTTGHEAEARRELSEKRPGRFAQMLVRLLRSRG
jgi:hypothetical protein